MLLNNLKNFQFPNTLMPNAIIDLSFSAYLFRIRYLSWSHCYQGVRDIKYFLGILDQNMINKNEIILVTHVSSVLHQNYHDNGQPLDCS